MMVVIVVVIVLVLIILVLVIVIITIIIVIFNAGIAIIINIIIIWFSLSFYQMKWLQQRKIPFIHLVVEQQATVDNPGDQSLPPNSPIDRICIASSADIPWPTSASHWPQ